MLLDNGYLTGSAAYTLSAFYDSSVKEPGFLHSFAGLLAWEATPRLRLTLSEALLQSDDPVQTDRLQLTRGRQKVTSNVTGLSGDYSFEPYAVKPYYRFSQITSDSDTTNSHTVGLTASTTLARIHVLTAGYEYLMNDTTPRTTGTTTPGAATGSSSLTGHQITGSISRDLSERMTMGISGAYAVRDQQTSTGSSSFSRWNFSYFSNYIVPEKLVIQSSIGVGFLNSDSSSGAPSLTSSTAISYWLGPAVLTLGIERGFSETFGQFQNSGVIKTSSVSGGVLYRFSPLLSGQLTGSYRENEFTGLGDGTGGAGGGNGGRADKVYTAGINVTYQITRWLTATFDATRTRSESSLADSSFNENRVRASLNAILY